MRMDQGGEALRWAPKEDGGGGDADECDLLAVGRPDGLGIAIDAGIEIGEGLGGDVVDGDEGVIGARGDVGELGAIGRPAKLAGLALGVDQLRWLGVVIEADGPDFAFAEESEAVAGGRDGGIVAFGDFARSAAGERSDPDGLLDALRKAGRIGIVAIVFEIAAADEDDGAAVGGPGELGDFLAVVVAIICERGGRSKRGQSAIHTLRAPCSIEHPGDGSAFGGGGELGGEWSAHHLFEREACGGGGEAKERAREGRTNCGRS